MKHTLMILLASALAACGQVQYAFTNFAGLPGVSGSDDGTGSAALFNKPGAVAVDGAGNVYAADTYNHTVRKITPAGEVTTLAGSAGEFRGSDDGIGNAARFWYPRGVAVDTAGNIYAADTFNYTIRKITPAREVTTLAGSAGQQGSADGTGSAARFTYPESVAVDSTGNVYVADTGNHTMRKITPAGAVTTLAGRAGQIGSADGTGSVARFDYPWGVAVDNANNVYVADNLNHTMRKITPAGAVTTLAGNAGQSGSDDGIGSAARFNGPRGVAVDSVGNLYVTDGAFYGTTRYGGENNKGTVFRLTVPPPPPVFQMPIQSGNNLTLTWSALSGRAYQVQFKTDLTQTNWTNLGTALTATNTTAFASDILGRDPQRFYRTVLLP